MCSLLLIFLIPLSIQARSQSKPNQKLDKLLNNPDKVEKLDFQFTTQSEFDYLMSKIALFKNLKRLFLNNRNSKNRVIVSEDVLKLKGLVRLTVEHADISVIIDEFYKLENLESLSLWDCKLISIPESIYRLENLTYLSLDLNKINSISPQISALQNLTILTLQIIHFQISEIRSIRYI